VQVKTKSVKVKSKGNTALTEHSEKSCTHELLNSHSYRFRNQPSM